MSEKATKQNPHMHVNRDWRTILKLSLLLLLILSSVGLGMTISSMEGEEEISTKLIFKLILFAVWDVLLVFGVLMYTELGDKGKPPESQKETDKPDDKKE
jgi:hypothetical protein